MRYLIMVFALLSVGCKHTDQTKVLTERYSKVCADMGAVVGTDAHISCTTSMVNAELNRRAQASAQAGAYGRQLLDQSQPRTYGPPQVVCRQVGQSVICQ